MSLLESKLERRALHQWGAGAGFDTDARADRIAIRFGARSVESHQ